VVAEASDSRAVEQARRHGPDAVLLDIRMPGMDGLQAAAGIRRAVPATAVIMLTMFCEDEYIARALEGGQWLRAEDRRPAGVDRGSAGCGGRGRVPVAEGGVPVDLSVQRWGHRRARDPRGGGARAHPDPHRAGTRCSAVGRIGAVQRGDQGRVE
jgi:CheY-like chemotaxis protein